MPSGEFHTERVILEDLRAREEQLQREIEKRCDWDDPSDVAELRRADRHEERGRVLDVLVPGRACPVCGTLKPSSRQWVVNRPRTKAVCRSCFQRASVKEGSELVDQEIFELDIRCRVNGATLIHCRELAGLSASEFARRAGWSRQWQRELEQNVQSIELDSAHVIIQVLREAGIVTADSLV